MTIRWLIALLALPVLAGPARRQPARPAAHSEDHAAAVERDAVGPVSGAGAVLQPDLFSERPLDTPGLDRFAVVGDDGSGDDHQKHVHEALEREHASAPFASVIKLGDNVYDKGEEDLFDGRIRRPIQPLLDKGVRFYPTLGNHDVPAALGEAQLRYWGAPRWYNERLGRSMELFAVDTTLLLPEIQEGAYDALMDWAAELARQELAWLEKALAGSKAKFKIVFGHHPMYASFTNEEKQKDAERLRGILEPILAAAKVPLYLSGHEHLYERSEPIKGVTHIVSGGGGAEMAKHFAEKPDHPRETLAQKHHYMIFEARGRALRFRAKSPKGRVLDEGKIELP